MIPNSYKTISSRSEAQYRVLGSRHLAFGFHVRTEEEIKELLESLWKENHNATHICYAWRLGWDKLKFRLNDDSEPSGTAGKPIYGQILSFDLTNILIAVVRYYGGTKLGTGGLIEAYKTASKACIENATIIEKQVMDHYILHFDHYQMPVVMKALKEMQMEKLASSFESVCTLEFLIKMEYQDQLVNLTKDLEDLKLLHLGRS